MPQSVVGRVRSEHPRLFWTPETIPEVIEHAETQEPALLEASRALLDRIAPDEDADFGTEASIAAFVATASGEAADRDLAIDLLDRSVAHYEACFEQEEAVSWYAHSRINALAAYDWLYPELPDDRRRELGGRLLEAVARVQPTDDRAAFPRENWGDTESGFYGTPCLTWYAGVVFAEAGIDDDLARRLLRDGYEQYTDLLEHRASIAGDVWGSASATPNYALNQYPWAEFLFFHTHASATGTSIATDWPHVARLPSYVYWNWLPGCREFGPGDSHHARNQLYTNSIDAHLAQIQHFYAETNPEAAGLARWLADRVPREFDLRAAEFPYIRFFLTDGADVEPRPPGSVPYAKQFPGLGQLYFRSDHGPESTYASLTASGSGMHGHYDAGHFNIFKDGFLALDSGTRPNPSTHLSHYYPRTVAHNCVTIRMPGEELPTGWGTPDDADPDPPNDGGQRRLAGADVVAYEAAEEYAYAAIDATDTYHDAKCELALRQFVYCPPDHFVVFDRVRTTDAGYPKRWLLHTASEPEVGSNGFAVESEAGLGNDYPTGRLYAKTLEPRSPRIETVGGPGEQFVADGRNWPFPEQFVTEELPLFGQWRVAVRPEEKRRTDYFLHLLEADLGDQEYTHRPTPPPDPAAGPTAELLESDDERGVRFRAGDRQWRVRFGTEGSPSGHLGCRDGDSTAVDRALTESVQRQPGLF